MKKIALLLAMVMLLVCVLASCGGNTDESKADTQSNANSEAENNNSSDESEEQSIEPAAVGKLISVGKPYTKSNLHRQGGADVDYAWDENAPISYPDEDDVTLTDGIFDPGDNEYSNAVWAGFSGNTLDFLENGYAWIIVDLEEKTDISKITLTVASSALGYGIGADGFTVMFFVSDDGEEWTSLGSQVAVDDESVNYVDVSMPTNTSGQYVKVQMIRGGWMFVSEISVYDVAAE